jgi:hypothetical protein
MREVDAAEVWLLLAVAIIAVLFFVGLLMPGGVTAPWVPRDVTTGATSASTTVRSRRHSTNVDAKADAQARWKQSFDSAS